MVLETIGLIFAFIVVGFLASAVSYRIGVEHGRMHALPVVEPVLPADMYDELVRLRHLKAQLDTPPQHHDHIWPRDPDMRKLGWLRYRCAYSGCPAIKWDPS